MKKLVTKPIFGIVLLLLAIGILSAYYFIPEKYGNAVGTIFFDEPGVFTKSMDGRYALADDSVTVYVMDENCNYDYVVDMAEDEYVSDIAFDEEGYLYILTTGVEENEPYYSIKKYDKAGKFIRDVLRIQDDDMLSVYAICIEDDVIRFVESDLEYDYIVEYDMNNGDKDKNIIQSNYDDSYVVDAATDGNGNYVVMFSDRTVGIVYDDYEYEDMFYCFYDIFDEPDEIAPVSVALYDEGVAFAGTNYYAPVIMYSDDADEYPVMLADTSEYFTSDDFDGDMDGLLYINYISSLDGGIAVSAYRNVFILDENQNVTEIESCKNIPFTLSLIGLLHRYGSIVGFVLLFFGAVLCTGNLMKWHLNLLWKQIFFTMPVVILMFVFLTYGFVYRYTELYDISTAQRLMQINQSGLGYIDANQISDMTNYEIVEDGRMYELSMALNENLAGGDKEWSKGVETTLYLFDEGLNGIRIADSTISLSPFNYVFDMGDDVEQVYADADSDVKGDKYITREDDTVVLYSGTYDKYEEVTAVTFIFDDNDEAVGMLVSDLDYSEFVQEKNRLIGELVSYAAGFLAILLVTMFIFTYLNTRRLKKAGEAITEIAAGNFEARVENYGNDEVGAICGGVNEMAKQLEVHFEELDRNEKFYYKFVPEKFKELLHKESFTDLELGDAESADLTVLFCDIRSFSLNSEMMTAKENFEFVNVIYGKAGPIIRKHGGFVDKYIGDAVMALFENADDAVAAGQDLYKEIVLDKSTANQLGVSSINIGIGIHSGMARVGIVGEQERLSGTVISNTVNISSRLESLTKKYNTAMIITKDTLDRLSDPDSLSTRYLGMIQAAGVNEVKALYEVLECLDDERRIPREKIAFDFREAIKSYHLGKIEEAKELLEKLTGNSSVDPVPEMYLEYVKEKISSGDKEHNVFKFDKK